MFRFRCKAISIMVAVMICLCLFGANMCPAHAATRAEFNNLARNFLAEYYEPEDHLDTGLYNIQTGYTKKTYEDQDQLGAIYATTDEITENAETEREKVTAIHDWICENIKYATDLSNYTGYPYEDLGNPFTVYKTKEAVCYGYANLTQLMVQRAGIPCIVVRGSGLGGSHVWNAVYLEGEWVFTDNTWDASLSENGPISYRYHLMSNEQVDSSHAVQFMENPMGDVCYYPLSVSPSKTYHDIYLNAKGGDCIEKWPFYEGQKKFFLPIPKREGRSFYNWKSEETLKGFVYKNGYYMADEKIPTLTDDIYFTAVYSKTNPNYEVPKGIIAYEGQTLEGVALPSGFSWATPTQSVGTAGTRTFKAKYTPEDTDDYYVVSNIPIEVTVKKDDTYSATVTFDNTCPAIGDTITASISQTSENQRYVWCNSDGVIKGETGTSYTVRKEDAGKHIRVYVYDDKMTGGYATVRTSKPVGKISLSGVSLDIPRPIYGDTLTAVTIPEDADATYQWYNSDGIIEGATEKTYTPTSEDVMKHIRVYVKGSGAYTGNVTVRTTAPVQRAAIESVSLDIPRPTYGDTITAVTVPNNADATYQWYNSDGKIEGATGKSYTPTSKDVMKHLRVYVKGVNGYTGSVTVRTTAPVQRLAITVVSLDIPRPTYGDTITAVTVPEDANATYQWYNSDGKIEGATGKTYTPTPEDIMKHIRVYVKGTGAYTGSVTVRTTAPVQR